MTRAQRMAAAPGALSTTRCLSGLFGIQSSAYLAYRTEYGDQRRLSPSADDPPRDRLMLRRTPFITQATCPGCKAGRVCRNFTASFWKEREQIRSDRT
jgi:hypothetical protein